ncbi:(2Fe-2S)-binding protein [Haladaptatus sp. DYF46]|uniref:(2Fe-2S)-binding protein n=1 Tax=Haladaptatus sp. DYF46 TaxID=2886041 RepID=UPI001E3E0F3A|nr:(2Fe-2S)-binding protein [Haladaptatus sp. DYF46]
MSSKIVELTVNGQTVEEIVEPLEPLQSVLRDKLGNTATKTGCKQGGCGSCTVLIDGAPVMSCLVPVEEAEGEEITTLEGLATGDELHPLQKAFNEHFAMQCGYCTPGMIMVTKALLDRNPDPSRAEIRDAISGNICRCTGYDPIIDAVEATAESLNGESD